MQVMILKTDHGLHSPEKWAYATAVQLTPIDPNADALVQRDGFALQLKIAKALEEHHAAVQAHDAEKLTEDHSHIMAEIDPMPWVEEALAAVVECAKGGRWEEKYSQEDVQNEMRSVIASHFATSQHTSRSHHADKHPDNEHAIAFKALHHPGVE